ncbi:hypothetical protein GCM10023088_41030 [Actinomadura verrucosospora]
MDIRIADPRDLEGIRRIVSDVVADRNPYWVRLAPTLEGSSRMFGPSTWSRPRARRFSPSCARSYGVRRATSTPWNRPYGVPGRLALTPSEGEGQQLAHPVSMVNTAGDPRVASTPVTLDLLARSSADATTAAAAVLTNILHGNNLRLVP